MISTKPLPGATIDYQHPINLGLLGRWLFNEHAGSRVADISGKRNHGTITNVDLTAGWTGSPGGGGLKFDGIDDYVRVPKSPSFAGFQNLSIVCRLKIIQFVSQDQLCAQYITTGNQRSWRLFQAAAGRDTIGFVLSDDGTLDAGHAKQGLGALVAFDGTWHQIGFTFNGPASEVNLYVDGRQDEVTLSTDDPITSLHNSTNDVIIAAQSPSDYMEGTFDYLRMWDRVLNLEEIREMHVNPYLGLLD